MSTESILFDVDASEVLPARGLWVGSAGCFSRAE
jgi:hypothetical protein